MKIGIFGGTFDPIHHGHLIIAEFLYFDLSLDRILFVPSGTPPHKTGQSVTSFNHRWEMVRLAIHAHPYFDCSDIEQHHEGPCYSIDILCQIKRQYSEKDTFFFIMGADSLKDLHTWHQPDTLLKSAQVVVVDRAGVDTTTVKSEWLRRIHSIQTPLIEISSTNIRDHVRHGQSIRYQVPESVRQYIEKKGLYQ